MSSFFERIGSFHSRHSVLSSASEGSNLGKTILQLAEKAEKAGKNGKKLFAAISPKLTPRAIHAIPIDELGGILRHVACDDGVFCLKLILDATEAEQIYAEDLNICGTKIGIGCFTQAAVVLLTSTCAEKLSAEVLEFLLISVCAHGNVSLATQILNLPSANGIGDATIGKMIMQAALKNEIALLQGIIASRSYTGTALDNGNAYALLIRNGFADSAESFRDFIHSREGISVLFEDNFPDLLRSAVDCNDLKSLRHLIQCYKSGLAKCDSENLSYQLVCSLQIACECKIEKYENFLIAEQILKFLDLKSLSERDKLKLQLLFWENKLKKFGEEIHNIVLESLITLIDQKDLEFFKPEEINPLIATLKKEIAKLPKPAHQKPKPEEIKV